MRRNKFDKKERINALRESYDSVGKGSGFWYILGDDECKEFGFKKLIPKPGNVFLVILPRPDSPKFFEQIYVHYNVGPNQYAFLCPNKMYDEDCPVCNYRKELSDRGEPDDVLRLYSYTTRVLLWVVNVENSRTVDEGVYLYDAPNSILKGIAGQTRDIRTGEIIDISDPVEDLELQFVRTGKDMHTKYDSFKVERRAEEIPEEYYDIPIDMVDVLIQPDVDEMRKALGILVKRDRAPESPSSERDVDRNSKIDDSEVKTSGETIGRNGGLRREQNIERGVFPSRGDEKEERRRRIREKIDAKRRQRENDNDDLPY